MWGPIRNAKIRVVFQRDCKDGSGIQAFNNNDICIYGTSGTIIEERQMTEEESQFVNRKLSEKTPYQIRLEQKRKQKNGINEIKS